MKFNFPLAQTIEDIKRILDAGLQRLRLDENFIHFIVTVTIPSGTEFQIPNKLKSIPTKRIILRQTGNGHLTDGDFAWTRDILYIKNHGPDDTTATIIFME